MMACLSWLEKLKESFASTGLDYEDLYELIEASITRKRTNFPAFINEASKGLASLWVRDISTLLIRIGMILKSLMRSVSFLGEVETSSIPVLDYVFLMKIAADVYSDFFPEERDSVLSSAKKLEERYSKRFPV